MQGDLSVAGPSARAVLRNRRMLRATLGFFLFHVVEIAIWLAVVLWAFDRGGAWLAGLVAVVQLLPAAGLAPALATFGDTVPRGTALVAAHLSVAVTCLLTAVALAVDDAPVALVVLASTAATTAVAVVRPIHFAAIPQLARRPEELVAANALCTVAEGVSYLVGNVVAGALYAASGAVAVLAASAVTALVATALCLRLRLGRPPAAQDEPSVWVQATQGLRVLLGDAPALALLLVLTTQFVIAGALDVLGVAFAADALGRDETGAGVLIGALGLGGLIGGAAAGALGQARRLAPVVVGSAVGQGIAFALVATSWSLPTGVVAVALTGASGAVLVVAGRTLLQRATDDAVLARVFAVQESASLIGLAVGSAAAPWFIHSLGARTAFVPLGLACTAACLLVALLVRRLDARADHRPAELALLRSVPFLALLPPYELERLARACQWLVVDAGTVVVRQGDPGSDYFVVADGDLTVSVDGVARPHRLGAGDGFGEIALLQRSPRTATVTATTTSRLLQIGSTDFLAAVTGDVDGARVADETATAHLARDAAVRRRTALQG